MRGLEEEDDEVGEDEEERRGDGEAERDAAAGHAEGARRVRLGAAELHEGEEEERHVHLRRRARGARGCARRGVRGRVRVCVRGDERGVRGEGCVRVTVMMSATSSMSISSGKSRMSARMHAALKTMIHGSWVGAGVEVALGLGVGVGVGVG